MKKIEDTRERARIEGDGRLLRVEREREIDVNLE